MRTAALLPLKDFVNAKQRLAGVLAPHERRALFHAMVEDVLRALTAAQKIDHVLIISDDPTAAMFASQFGVKCISEHECGVQGLNAVVTFGVQQLVREGFERVLVTHGDLPLLDADDLDAMLRSARDGICIAPDAKRDGSNVMVCVPPTAIEFHYGSGSCLAHINDANRRGVACSQWLSPRMAMDVDVLADLIALIGSPLLALTSTGRYLAQSGIPARLQAMESAANSVVTPSERISP